MTIAECLKRAAELASESARLDLEVLLCWVLKKDRAYLYTWPEKQLNPEQLAHFDSALARRKAGEPIAYIVEEKEFWSLPLYVDESTLIPRADTETLVETALGKINSPMKILDLGTGTGVIAIALASERPDCQVVATDKSSAALAVAQRNRERFGLKNLAVLASDWFADIEERDFDMIVSNPPYVDPNDPHLCQGDLRFEPASALIAGENGLADIRKIIEMSTAYLKRNGWLLLEHGWQQGIEVRRMLQAKNFFNVETVRDYAGNDRVTLGQSGGGV